MENNMESFAKEGQDILVRKLIKRPGFYLDIGCAEPHLTNNTYALERLGWRGILLDSNPGAIEECRRHRSAPSYCVDVTQMDWQDLLHKHDCPKVIDYISLDVDDANIQVIQAFPLDSYQFKIMTFETDFYNNGGIRQRFAREVLAKYPQYDLLLEDAQLEDGRAWEDWWFNTTFLDLSPSQVKHKGMYWKDFLEKL